MRFNRTQVNAAVAKRTRALERRRLTMRLLDIVFWTLAGAVAGYGVALMHVR